MGFSMILYPATVLFRTTRAIQQALQDLAAGEQLSAENSVDMKQFEQIVDMDRWRSIQKKYGGGPNWDEP